MIVTITIIVVWILSLISAFTADPDEDDISMAWFIFTTLLLLIVILESFKF